MKRYDNAWKKELYNRKRNAPYEIGLMKWQRIEKIEV